VIYPHEHFDADERRRLAPYFTNLDRPVFALVNLPETVKGALFARYARYPGTLRRLFLEEFADGLPESPHVFNSNESRRAADLYDRVFVGFGDDSVAQLGGAHLACEWTSNVLTKILQRPRLASYLEQSTRYIAYDKPMPGGGFRYYRDPTFGSQYARSMDEIFRIYSGSMDRVQQWVVSAFPVRDQDDRRAYARAARAKTFDILRGLLPAASLSHTGIFASGQTYEQLVLRLFASPLPEARHYGEMILDELRRVIPSFLARIDRPDRGDAWVDYVKERSRAGAACARRLGLLDQQDEPVEPSVRLVDVSGEESDVIASLLFEAGAAPESAARAAAEKLSEAERGEVLRELAGSRGDRRNRPGRGLECVRYRFEVVSDYAAFRDLQRHRMLTVQWQPLSPRLGAEIPEAVDLAGVGTEYRRALEISRREHDRLRVQGLEGQAMYPLCMAYRIRYVMDLNAREAMHVIELRSGRQGHANYRRVAREMHDLIRGRHPGIAALMVHVDRSDDAQLERISAEARNTSRAADVVALERTPLLDALDTVEPELALFNAAAE
jgi:thymidylate synthase ThyX